jgi:hypothetical protein
VGYFQVNEEEQHATAFPLRAYPSLIDSGHILFGCSSLTVSRGSRPQRVLAVDGLACAEIRSVGYPGASRSDGMPTMLQRQLRATSPEPRAP